MAFSRRGKSADSNYHRIGSDQVFDAGLAETCFAHPAAAVCAGVVETSGCLDEHIEAHQEAKCVGTTLVIDQGIVDDKSSTFRKGFVRAANQKALLFHIPIVKNVTHCDYVCFRQGIGEETAGCEMDAR